MSLNRQNVKALQTALGEAAGEVARASGIDGLEALRGSRATFDPVTGTVKVSIEFAIRTSDQERSTFNAHARLFAVAPEAYGAKLTSRGVEYRLVGFNLRRHRFPIEGRDASGRTMLFTSDILRQLPEALRA